ncbi:MAG: hypothetical protein LUG98_13125 [Tannerellaceae bacterium]|nr:hypothetical protein [Tannerellaceae bacterium]
MNYLKIMYGTPFTNIKGLTEQFKISDRTARTMVKEMEQHRDDRYGDLAVINSDGLKRINVLAFTDFFAHRKELQEPNLAKQLPSYNPMSVAQQLGFYGETET